MAEPFDSLCHLLDNLPGQLERRLREREAALSGLRAGHADSIKQLKQLIVDGKSYQKDVDRLMASLKNAAPLLAKFNKQAEKDEALMLELGRKAGRPSFGTDHPIYRAQRDALQDAVQKLVFPIKELQIIKVYLERHASRLDQQAIKRMDKLLAELDADLNKISRSLIALS